jgi:hypothetical protein
LAFAPAPAVQARPGPGATPIGHPASAFVAQGKGAAGSFEVDPVRLGLSRGGGSPLPQAVLAKMEAAFGADFSAVRIHVGPQASRIGAVAFTMGDDLYFAPGRFQPDSAHGQQLIGHELAHVVQQRQGRVRGPAGAVTVIQDRTLELEADRLGARAAGYRGAAQCKLQSAGAFGLVQRSALPAPAAKPVLKSKVFKKDHNDCGSVDVRRFWKLTGGEPGIILQHVTRDFTGVVDVAAGNPIPDIDAYAKSATAGAFPYATELDYWEWWEVDANGEVVGGKTDTFGLCAIIPKALYLTEATCPTRAQKMNTTKGVFVQKGSAWFIPCQPIPASSANLSITGGLACSLTKPQVTATANRLQSDQHDFTLTVSWDSTKDSTLKSDIQYVFA